MDIREKILVLLAMVNSKTEQKHTISTMNLESKFITIQVVH